MVQPIKRIAEFEKLGLGLFVHWGLYSQIGSGEWVFNSRNMNMEEYKELAKTFTAEDFDAKELVRTAKRNGFKYITLTTRHHEGFSLYDTCGMNEFDAPHSGAKRDIIREFTDASHEYGILPFFYHTTFDWYNNEFEKDFEKYLGYLQKSVELLCKNYGKIGGFWFDGNWKKPDADWKEEQLYKTIRKYQPDAIIINNTGIHARGARGNCEIDSVTFEQGKPNPINTEKSEKYLASEVCMTMNDHWGLSCGDYNYKSPRELIESLCECRKYGSNCLLNIGPEAQGGIPEIEKGYLDIIGKWMEVYGEAIYNGKPYINSDKSRNFILKGKDSLYIFVFDLTINGSENVIVNTEESEIDYTFDNVNDNIKEIYWMDNNEQLEFLHKDNKLKVNFTQYPYGTNRCVRVAKALLS